MFKHTAAWLTIITNLVLLFLLISGMSLVIQPKQLAPPDENRHIRLNPISLAMKLEQDETGLPYQT